MALLGARFYWPQMKEDVESYVQTCLVCQQDKIKHKKPGGELDPLPILTRPSKCYYGFHLVLAQGRWACSRRAYSDSIVRFEEIDSIANFIPKDLGKFLFSYYVLGH